MRFEDQATLNILARTSGSVLLMGSSVIMTRFLTKEEYGLYLQAMLLLNTVTLLSFVGIGQSIYYYYPQVDDRRSFVRNNLLLGLAIGALTALLLYLGKGLLPFLFKDREMFQYLPFLCALLLLQGPTNLKDPIFLSSGALVANSALTVVSSVIDYLPLCLLVMSRVGLEWLFWAAVASRVVNLAIFAAVIRRYCYQRGPASRDQGGQRVSLLDQFRYLLPVSAAGYVATIGKQIDKYLIANGFSAAQFATYSRGATDIPFISTITYLINDITLPRYVAAYQRRDIVSLVKMMHTNIDKVAKINFPIFVFLMVEASLFMEILYTRAYLDATPIFQVYLLSLLCGVTVYNMIPTVSGNTRLLLIATVISVVTTIVSGFTLLKLLGPVGVALGSFLGSFSYMVFLLYRSLGILSLSWREIMPWRNLAKIFSVALGAVGVVLLFNALLAVLEIPDGLCSLCVAFALFTYCYLGGLTFMNLLYREDREYLARWLRFDLFVLMPWVPKLEPASEVGEDAEAAKGPEVP
ncbi:lipopolysaccharide biosynthesis protein [Geomonas sp.]|uniref:lipopolysaccharide biosynthesis protein n=1 Tax=Geomonas sp. TaxID=2651584 RepID=UPI002B48F5FF|nr:lipopolysaccharide biosynthesis protein [Geomonas sp.]HJV36213.1 lipopolysaccharide biosynthesis protein [Geomonas sp.]